MLTVVTAKPELSGAGDELVLPGIVQAYIESPIYARTNGYLKSWYTDIGARVHQGQLLAEIETPEVDRQLAQARADLRYGAGQLRAREDHQRTLAGLAQDAGRFQTGRRQQGGRCRGEGGHGRVGTSRT